MKKSIYIVLLAFAALFTFASCEREFSMKEVGTESVAPVLAAVSDQVIDANNSKAESVIFNWTPASFGAPVQVEYTLYLTREGASDYLIAQTFSTAVAVEKATINSGAVALGIEKNGTGTVGAKVVADVYTGPGGSASFAMSNTSNSISFDVTTFEAPKDWIFLPGVYNGWGDSNEKEEWKVWEMDGGSKVYRTLVQFESADWCVGFCPFKIFANGAWLGYNDGYEPAWGRIYSNDDGNWAVPEAEPINFITVNMTTKKGTREAVSKVGIIGSFCDWADDKEVSFVYDKVNNVWNADVTFSAGDTFLIRLNGDWGFKYGTATNPASGVPGGFELVEGSSSADIAAPGAGEYTVRLHANRTPLVISYIAK
jgi:hypothetical protein